MRYLLVSLIAIAQFLPLQVSAEPQIAAIVNDKKILVSDIDGRISRHPLMAQRFQQVKSNPQALFFVRRSVLNTLIDRMLLLKLAKQSDRVKDSLIEKGVEARIKQQFGDSDKMAAKLKEQGLTVEQFRSELADDMRLDQFVREDLIKGVTVTDAEVRAQFDAEPEKYGEPEQVRARHILIKVGKDAKADEEAAARKKIDEIRKLTMKKGADFGAIAKDKSEGPSAPRGGDLGFFGQGRMVPEFDKAVFSMKPGEISKPVRTQFGFHIIKLDERKAATAPSFEAAKPMIKMEIERQKRSKIMEEQIKKLREKAKIEIKLKPGPA